METKKVLPSKNFIPLAVSASQKFEKAYLQTGEKLRKATALNPNILNSWENLAKVATQILQNEISQSPVANRLENGLIHFKVKACNTTAECEETPTGFEIRIQIDIGTVKNLLFSHHPKVQKTIETGVWMLIFHELAHCLHVRNPPEADVPGLGYINLRRERIANTWGMAGALHRANLKKPEDLTEHLTKSTCMILLLPEILGTPTHLQNLKVLKRTIQKNLQKIQDHQNQTTLK